MFILVIKLLVICLFLLPIFYAMKVLGGFMQQPWIWLGLFIDIVNQKK
jgi:hypothetical protein